MLQAPAKGTLLTRLMLTPLLATAQFPDRMFTALDMQMVLVTAIATAPNAVVRATRAGSDTADASL